MPAFGALGTSGVGTGTLTNVAFPTGITAGQLLLCFITHKYSGVSVASISDGFTLLTPEYSGGSGASGADSGIVVGTIAWKVASGSESGNISSIVFSGAVNAARGQVFRYTSTGTANWDLDIVGGSVNTPTVSWSVAMDGDPSILSAADGGDDMLIAFSVKNADLKTASAEAVTGTGLTSNLIAERLDNNGSTGDDFGTIVSDHSVINSLTSGVPTYTMSMSGTAGANEPAGATILLRVREAAVGSVGTSAGAATVAGTGAATSAGAGSMTGPGNEPKSTVTGVGRSTADAAGTSAGAAAASAGGASTAEAAGSTAGATSTAGAGASTADAAGSSAGSSTAEAESSGSTVVDAVGSSAGAATAAGVGASDVAGAGSSAGGAAATAAGASLAAAAGAAAGATTTDATGAANSNAAGDSSGSSTADAAGAAGAAGVGTTTGAAAADAVGASTAAADGASAGAATGTGVAADAGAVPEGPPSFEDYSADLEIDDYRADLEIDDYTAELILGEDGMGYSIKTGNLTPGLTGRIRVPPTVNLSGATLVVVLRGQKGGRIEKEATLVGRVAGSRTEWRWRADAWELGETDVADEYAVEVTATKDDLPATYPNAGTGLIEIYPRL